MNPTETIHLPLASAYLCEDCSCVGNSPKQCPACASEALMGLAGVLNRTEQEGADRKEMVASA